LSGSYSGTMVKGTITGEWKQPGSALPLILTPYKKPEANSLTPLLGEWVGILEPPGSGIKLTIVFRFQISKEGKFAGVLDSPDQNAKDIPVGDVLLEGDQVTIKVPVAQADYSGKLVGTKINGSFKQAGQEFTVNLTKGKYQPPPAFADLSQEAMKQLLGQWIGKWKVSEELSYTAIFRFEKAKDGKFIAVADLPEQGVKGFLLAGGVFKGDQLSFKIPQAAGEFAGTLSGNSISGTYKAGGKPFPLIVTRGAKYEPPITQIEIPDEAMKTLLGKWIGKLGTVSVIFRFERNAAGVKAIFVDSPEQSLKGMPVIKASLVDGNLVLKFKEDQYSGKISGNKIEGSLKINNGQATVPLPVTKQ
jgi:hypothetical protein